MASLRMFLIPIVSIAITNSEIDWLVLPRHVPACGTQIVRKLNFFRIVLRILCRTDPYYLWPVRAAFAASILFSLVTKVWSKHSFIYAPVMQAKKKAVSWRRSWYTWKWAIFTMRGESGWSQWRDHSAKHCLTVSDYVWTACQKKSACGLHHVALQKNQTFFFSHSSGTFWAIFRLISSSFFPFSFWLSRSQKFQVWCL